MIRLDYDKAACFLKPGELESAGAKAYDARKILLDRTGEGSEYTGWVDLPENYDREEYARIRKAAEKIRRDSDVLVVIGIGGSYLGAKAAIEILNHSFFNALPAERRSGPQVFFCGCNMSAKYLRDLTDMLDGKEWSINVISKSGTTTEPAIAFRILKKMLYEQYGDKAAGRIYATTDRSRGALRTLAVREGYETFVVPDDVGGRYSVLTAVGLLPIAVSGIDTDRLLEGAAAARREAIGEPFETNTAMKYAAVRNCLYRDGRTVEILADYEPALHYLGEWWKQLYGESEGKDQKGLFPACADFTTDLHSFGQFIQDGTRIMFETVLNIDAREGGMIIEPDEDDMDGLNYLAGKSLEHVNKAAMEGTLLAHTQGAVPNMRITVDRLDAYTLGELFYMFEFACGVSGYMLGVNPFNQPGVESYKRNMFELLGKPGYRKQEV